MSQSESMGLHEKSEENHLSVTHEEDSSPSSDREVEQPLSIEEENQDDAPLNEDPSFGKDPLEKKKEQKEVFTPQFELFKELFDTQSEVEAKLQLAIDYMTTSLEQGGTPHFRSFWEARRLCLALFKENISPALRTHAWAKYSELSKEARRLKEILDEQSAFAVEQIEIAIHALEEEISQFETQNEKAAFPDSLPFPEALSEHYEQYQSLQRQLNVLNAQASRINALRKELLKTEMRVRHKNKFFQRLSGAGDKVFPKRKDLIKEISHQFSLDVEQFINKYFAADFFNETFYVLREEIKGLQGLAKLLTLNTHAFTQTRMRLSECWDRIKVEEKERKKERVHQRIVFKENAEEISKQIELLKQIIEKNEETSIEGLKRVEAIAAEMRRVELGRDEVRALRESLNEVRKMIQDQIKSSEDIRLRQEEERNRHKKEKFQAAIDQAERLLEGQNEKNADELIAERDALLTQIHDASLSKNEKQEIERILKPLRDIITDKREKALLDLSEDDRHALSQMQSILKQRKERRQEIKNQLEILRKGAGSSSLDFEKAMTYTHQINEEKERLEKANQAIQEIEDKIRQLQAKILNKL
ncbi:MAG: hypothetical protein ACH350_00860 [Parachlamydiaceae bacterium]